MIGTSESRSNRTIVAGGAAQDPRSMPQASAGPAGPRGFPSCRIPGSSENSRLAKPSFRSGTTGLRRLRYRDEPGVRCGCQAAARKAAFSEQAERFTARERETFLSRPRPRDAAERGRARSAGLPAPRPTDVRPPRSAAGAATPSTCWVRVPTAGLPVGGTQEPVSSRGSAGRRRKRRVRGRPRAPGVSWHRWRSPAGGPGRQREVGRRGEIGSTGAV